MRLQRGATFPFRGVRGRLSSRWRQQQRASQPPPSPSSQRQIAAQIRRVVTRASVARWLVGTPRQAGKSTRHAQTVSRERRSKTGKVGCGSKPNVPVWYLKVHAWWRAVQVVGFGEKSPFHQLWVNEFYKKGCQEKNLSHDRRGDCFSTSSPSWICFAESSCGFPFS